MTNPRPGVDAAWRVVFAFKGPRRRANQAERLANLAYARGRYNKDGRVHVDLTEGKYGGAGKEISEALGRKPESTDLNERHPFEVEILRIPPARIGASECTTGERQFAATPA